MYKNVIFRIVSIDKAVTALDIEPFHRSGHLCCYSKYLIILTYF